MTATCARSPDPGSPVCKQTVEESSTIRSSRTCALRSTLSCLFHLLTSRLPIASQKEWLECSRGANHRRMQAHQHLASDPRETGSIAEGQVNAWTRAQASQTMAPRPMASPPCSTTDGMNADADAAPKWDLAGQASSFQTTCSSIIHHTSSESALSSATRCRSMGAKLV